MTGEISLADFAAKGISVSWCEAVAISQQICQALLDHPGHSAVDVASVCLRPSGDITIQSSRSPNAEVSVQSVGVALRNWLAETPHPVPLKLVVAQATCTPPFYASVAELSEALSHYEHSDRQELLRDAYARWRSAAGRSIELSSEAEVQSAPPNALIPQISLPRSLDVFPVEGARRLWTGGLRSLHVVSVTAAVSVLIAIAGWLVADSIGRSVTTVSASIGHADDRAVGTLASVFEGVLNWLGTHSVRTGANAPAAAGVPATAALPRVTAPGATVPNANAPHANAPHAAVQGAVPVQARRRVTPQAAPGTPAPGVSLPTAPAATPPSGPAAAATPATGPAPVLPILARPVLVPPAPVPPALMLPAADTVYSRADSDVTPPVAIDLLLPDSPPPNGVQQKVAAIDIVVDQAGRVESATLARNPATLEEAMVATMNLSAAKNWRFRPALKGGRPVRYRRTIWLPIRS